MFFLSKKVTVKIQGGLGNQLFQIAAVLHYAKKFNYKPVFTNQSLIRKDAEVGQYTYMNLINTKKTLNLKRIKRKKYQLFREPKFNYTPFEKSKKSILLEGYFQSEQYVNSVKQEMEEIIWSNDQYTLKADSIYMQIKKKYATENLVSIHIRRGDYLKLSNIHTNTDISYYKEAISRFPRHFPVVVFSNDIEWCKIKISEQIQNPLYFVSEEDYVELLVMSKIKNNIIANSSFSWWSAYLNKHKDKQVIAPKKWFGTDWYSPDGTQDWSGIYCIDWDVI